MEPTTIQNYFEELIRKGEKPDPDFRIGRMDFGDIIALSDEVKDAWDYYFFKIEQADWGTARLYRLVVDDMTIYTIWATTDGDDGWLEVYDVQGNKLCVGKIDIDTVNWRGIEIREEV